MVLIDLKHRICGTLRKLGHYQIGQGRKTKLPLHRQQNLNITIYMEEKSKHDMIEVT